RWCEDHRPRSQAIVIGSELRGALEGGARDLGIKHPWLDRRGYACRHLILKLEDVFEISIISGGPKVPSGLDIDELTGDAKPLCDLPDRAFENIADCQFFGDLLQVDRLPLIDEARIAGDDEERAEARQRRDDVFSDPVG